SRLISCSHRLVDCVPGGSTESALFFSGIRALTRRNLEFEPFFGVSSPPPTWPFRTFLKQRLRGSTRIHASPLSLPCRFLDCWPSCCNLHPSRQAVVIPSTSRAAFGRHAVDNSEADSVRHHQTLAQSPETLLENTRATIPNGDHDHPGNVIRIVRNPHFP